MPRRCGRTFTVSNLGAFGVETFTPMINPECAVLGVGRIERRPVMDGDRVVGRERMTLSSRSTTAYRRRARRAVPANPRPPDREPGPSLIS
ncbi:MAG: 2-oxo acid dehydrogenase subunit E2 [Isosphaeraceae bacterium]